MRQKFINAPTHVVGIVVLEAVKLFACNRVAKPGDLTLGQLARGIDATFFQFFGG